MTPPTLPARPKLSPLAIDLLLAMQRDVRLHYMTYNRSYDAHYFRVDTMKPCTKQAKALIRAGLVQRVGAWKPDYVLSDAGKAWKP